MTDDKTTINTDNNAQPDSSDSAAVVAVPEAGLEISPEAKEKKAARTSKSKGKKKKKKERHNIGSGRAYVSASYNNTIISLTDQKGDVIAWASAGSCGFRGPKKATPYAAQMIVKTAVDRAKEQGLREVNVFVKGVGTGRESAVRALNANGLNIIAIKDMTPIPHNGCRPRKPRRI